MIDVLIPYYVITQVTDKLSVQEGLTIHSGLEVVSMIGQTTASEPIVELFGERMKEHNIDPNAPDAIW